MEVMKAPPISDENDRGTVVKRLSVPLGLEELMSSLTKEVLRTKPKDIYNFASEHFAQLLALRDSGGYQKEFISISQAADKIEKEVESANEKGNRHQRKSGKHLPRQVSIRAASPVQNPNSISKIKRISTPKIDDKPIKKEDVKKTKPKNKRAKTPANKTNLDRLEPDKEDALKTTPIKRVSRRPTDKTKPKDSSKSQESKRSSSEESVKVKSKLSKEKVKSKETITNLDNLKEKKETEKTIKSDSETGELVKVEKDEKSEKNTYDPTTLREELQHAANEAKLNNFTTSHNPYILRQEIKNAAKYASVDNDTTEKRMPAKDDNKSEDKTISEKDNKNLNVSEATDIADISTDKDKPEEKPDSPKSSSKNLASAGLQHSGELHDSVIVENVVIKSANTENEVKYSKFDTGDIALLAMAATKIQAFWRGFTSRQNKHSLQNDPEYGVVQKDAATKIQTSVRGFLTRKQYKLNTQNKNGENILNATEMVTESDNTNKVAQAATKIQAGIRGYLTRKQTNLTKIKENNKVTDQNFQEQLQQLESLSVPSESPSVEQSKSVSLSNTEKSDINDIDNKLKEQPFRSQSVSSLPTGTKPLKTITTSLSVTDSVISKSQEEDLDKQHNVSEGVENSEEDSADLGIDSEKSATQISINEKGQEKDITKNEITDEAVGVGHSTELLDTLTSDVKTNDQDEKKQIEDREESSANHLTQFSDLDKDEANVPLQHSSELHDTVITQQPEPINQNGKEPLPTPTENHLNQNIASDEDTVLNHSGELHDLVISQTKVDNENSKESSTGPILDNKESHDPLEHSSEMHDTAIIPQTDQNIDEQIQGGKETLDLNLNKSLEPNDVSLKHNSELHDFVIPETKSNDEVMKASTQNSEEKLTNHLNQRLTVGKDKSKVPFEHSTSVTSPQTETISKSSNKKTKKNEEISDTPLTQNSNLNGNASLEHSSELHDIVLPQTEAIVEDARTKIKDSEESTIDHLNQNLDKDESNVVLEHSSEMHDTLTPKIEETDQKINEQEQKSEEILNSHLNEYLNSKDEFSLAHTSELHDIVLPDVKVNDEDIKTTTQTLLKPLNENLNINKDGSKVTPELHDDGITPQTERADQDANEKSQKLEEENNQELFLKHSSELHDIVLPQTKANDSNITKQIEDPAELPVNNLNQTLNLSKEDPTVPLEHSSEIHDSVINPNEDVSLEHSSELHDTVLPEIKATDQDIQTAIQSLPKPLNETLIINKDESKVTTELHNSVITPQTESSKQNANEKSQKLEEENDQDLSLKHSSELHDIVVPQTKANDSNIAKQIENHGESPVNNLNQILSFGKEDPIVPLEHSSEIHDTIIPQIQITDQTIKEDIEKREEKHLNQTINPNEDISLKHTSELYDNAKTPQTEPADQNTNEQSQKSKESLENDQDSHQIISLKHSSELHDIILPQTKENDSNTLKQIENSEEFPVNNSNQILSLGKEEPIVSLEHSSEIHDTIIPETKITDQTINEDIQKPEETHLNPNEERSSELHDILVSEIESNAKDAKTSEHVSEKTLTNQFNQISSLDKAESNVPLEHSSEMHDTITTPTTEITDKHSNEEIQNTEKMVLNQNLNAVGNALLEHSSELHDIVVPEPKADNEDIKTQIQDPEQSLISHLNEDKGDTLATSQIETINQNNHDANIHLQKPEQSPENDLKQSIDSDGGISLDNDTKLHNNSLIPTEVNEKETNKHINEEGSVDNNLNLDNTVVSLEHSSELHDHLIPTVAENKNIKSEDNKMGLNGELNDEVISNETNTEKEAESKNVNVLSNLQENSNSSPEKDEHAQSLLEHSSELHDSVIIESKTDAKETDSTPEVHSHKEIEDTTTEQQLKDPNSFEKDKVTSDTNATKLESDIALQHTGEIHDSIVIKDIPNLQSNIQNLESKTEEPITLNPKDSINKVNDENVDGLVKEVLLEDPKNTNNISDSKLSQELNEVLQSNSSVELPLQHTGELHDLLVSQTSNTSVDLTANKDSESEENGTKQTKELDEKKTSLDFPNKDVSISSKSEDLPDSKINLINKHDGLQHSGEFHDSVIVEDATLLSKEEETNQVQTVENVGMDNNNKSSSTFNENILTSVLDKPKEVDVSGPSTNDSVNMHLQANNQLKLNNLHPSTTEFAKEHLQTSDELIDSKLNNTLPIEPLQLAANTEEIAIQKLSTQILENSDTKPSDKIMPEAPRHVELSKINKNSESIETVSNKSNIDLTEDDIKINLVKKQQQSPEKLTENVSKAENDSNKKLNEDNLELNNNNSLSSAEETNEGKKLSNNNNIEKQQENKLQQIVDKLPLELKETILDEEDNTTTDSDKMAVINNYETGSLSEKLKSKDNTSLVNDNSNNSLSNASDKNKNTEKELEENHLNNNEVLKNNQILNSDNKNEKPTDLSLHSNDFEINEKNIKQQIDKNEVDKEKNENIDKNPPQDKEIKTQLTQLQKGLVVMKSTEDLLNIKKNVSDDKENTTSNYLDNNKTDQNEKHESPKHLIESDFGLTEKAADMPSKENKSDKDTTKNKTNNIEKELESKNIIKKEVKDNANNEDLDTKLSDADNTIQGTDLCKIKISSPDTTTKSLGEGNESKLSTEISNNQSSLPNKNNIEELNDPTFDSQNSLKLAEDNESKSIHSSASQNSISTYEAASTRCVTTESEVSVILNENAHIQEDYENPQIIKQEDLLKANESKSDDLNREHLDTTTINNLPLSKSEPTSKDEQSKVEIPNEQAEENSIKPELKKLEQKKKEFEGKDATNSEKLTNNHLDVKTKEKVEENIERKIKEVKEELKNEKRKDDQINKDNKKEAINMLSKQNNLETEQELENKIDEKVNKELDSFKTISENNSKIELEENSDKVEKENFTQGTVELNALDNIQVNENINNKITQKSEEEVVNTPNETESKENNKNVENSIKDNKKVEIGGVTNLQNDKENIQKEIIEETEKNKVERIIRDTEMNNKKDEKEIEKDAKIKSVKNDTEQKHDEANNGQTDKKDNKSVIKNTPIEDIENTTIEIEKIDKEEGIETPNSINTETGEEIKKYTQTKDNEVPKEKSKNKIDNKTDMKSDKDIVIITDDAKNQIKNQIELKDDTIHKLTEKIEPETAEQVKNDKRDNDDINSVGDIKKTSKDTEKELPKKHTVEIEMEDKKEITDSFEKVVDSQKNITTEAKEEMNAPLKIVSSKLTEENNEDKIKKDIDNVNEKINDKLEKEDLQSTQAKVGIESDEPIDKDIDESKPTNNEDALKTEDSKIKKDLENSVKKHELNLEKNNETINKQNKDIPKDDEPLILTKIMPDSYTEKQAEVQIKTLNNTKTFNGQEITNLEDNIHDVNEGTEIKLNKDAKNDHEKNVMKNSENGIEYEKPAVDKNTEEETDKEIKDEIKLKSDVEDETLQKLNDSKGEIYTKLANDFDKELRNDIKVETEITSRENTQKESEIISKVEIQNPESNATKEINNDMSHKPQMESDKNTNDTTKEGDKKTINDKDETDKEIGGNITQNLLNENVSKLDQVIIKKIEPEDKLTIVTAKGESNHKSDSTQNEEINNTIGKENHIKSDIDTKKITEENSKIENTVDDLKTINNIFEKEEEKLINNDDENKLNVEVQEDIKRGTSNAKDDIEEIQKEKNNEVNKVVDTNIENDIKEGKIIEQNKLQTEKTTTNDEDTKQTELDSNKSSNSPLKNRELQTIAATTIQNSYRSYRAKRSATIESFNNDANTTAFDNTITNSDKTKHQSQNYEVEANKQEPTSSSLRDFEKDNETLAESSDLRLLNNDNLEPARSPRRYSTEDDGKVTQALDLVLNQQLAVATPHAVEKSNSTESTHPEYIYIPLKGPDNSVTAEKNEPQHLLHSGEFHDPIVFDSSPTTVIPGDSSTSSTTDTSIEARNSKEVDQSETSRESVVSKIKDAGPVTTVLGTVLDQQLALTAPNAIEKDKSGPEYIHIPLKGPLNEDSFSGLQHTGEFHDAIIVDPTPSGNTPKSSPTSKKPKQIDLVEDITETDSSGKTRGSIASIIKEANTGTVKKALGDVLDQQLAITTPKAEIKKREQEAVEDPKYIYIPLKDPKKKSEDEESINQSIESLPLDESSKVDEKITSQNSSLTSAQPLLADKQVNESDISGVQSNTSESTFESQTNSNVNPSISKSPTSITEAEDKLLHMLVWDQSVNKDSEEIGQTSTAMTSTNKSVQEEEQVDARKVDDFDTTIQPTPEPTIRLSSSIGNDGEDILTVSISPTKHNSNGRKGSGGEERNVQSHLRSSPSAGDDESISKENVSTQSESPPLHIQTTQISPDNDMPLAVQLNQPPGATLLTSPTPDDAQKFISTEGAEKGTHASDKVDSSKDMPAKNSAHLRTSMETGNRKNASIVEKNMEEVAATKIQASFRGYQVRKQLKSKNGGIDSISQRRALRRKSSGKLRGSDKISQAPSSKPPSSDVEEKSATKIQAGVRGFLVRRRQKKTKNTTTNKSS